MYDAVWVTLGSLSVFVTMASFSISIDRETYSSRSETLVIQIESMIEMQKNFGKNICSHDSKIYPVGSLCYDKTVLDNIFLEKLSLYQKKINPKLFVNLDWNLVESFYRHQEVSENYASVIADFANKIIKFDNESNLIKYFDESFDYKWLYFTWSLIVCYAASARLAKSICEILTENSSTTEKLKVNLRD